MSSQTEREEEAREVQLWGVPTTTTIHIKDDGDDNCYLFLYKWAGIISKQNL